MCCEVACGALTGGVGCVVEGVAKEVTLGVVVVLVVDVDLVGVGVVCIR